MVNYPSKEQCNNDQHATGTGHGTVNNISELGQLDVLVNWEVNCFIRFLFALYFLMIYLKVSCNDDGNYFHAKLTAKTTTLDGFTIGDRKFSFDSAELSILRESKDNPVKFSLQANFCGLKNLKLHAFVIYGEQYAGFNAQVEFTNDGITQLPNNLRRRATGMYHLDAHIV